MQNIPEKQTTDLLTAEEFNKGIGQELNNAPLGAGLALDSDDENQLGRAMAIYGTVGDFYVDSGVADAYVLSAINLREVPDSLLGGMVVRFEAANTNTGATTVDVNGLGVKAVVKISDLSPLVGGEIEAGRLIEIVYIAGSDHFRLVSGGTTIVGGGGAGEANTLTNVGAGADVVGANVGVNFDIRGILGATGITAVVNVDNIDISVDETELFADTDFKIALHAYIKSMFQRTVDELVISDTVDGSGNPTFTPCP